jgi:Fe-S cluster assembly protein SufD
MQTEILSLNAKKGLGQKESFEQHLNLSVLPLKWKEWKQNNWDNFESLPMPRRKDQAWRFASRIDFDLDQFHVPVEVSERVAQKAIDRSNLVQSRAARFVFVDNQLVHRDNLPEEYTSKGAFFLPLHEACDCHPELMGDYLFQESTNLGSDKFHALHNAFSEGGYVLHIPSGTEIKEPFLVHHWHSEDGAALFPHVLLIGGNHSSFTVIDVQQSMEPDTRGFVCSVGNVFAGDGAQINRETVQNFNESVISFQLDTNNVEKDTTVRAINLNLGSKRARFENEVRINGAGSSVKLYSLSVPHKEQEFDQRTLQIHNAPNAVSDLLYKNALLDHSRTIFSGLIKVAKNAQQTDAYQTNRNLLLNDTAQANSLPGLEIEANDVKCSHGATTGQLDPEELFYFLQRGIPRRVAQRLMVFGFFEEVIQQFGNEELENALRTMIQSKFEKNDLDAS